MATVIDSLVLEFNLDTSQFTREQRRLLDQIQKMSEQARHQAADIEASVKRITNVFSNLQRGALGVIGGFLGGQVLQTIDHFNRMQVSAEQMGRTMNMAGADVQAFGQMFKNMNFSIEAGRSALQQLNIAMQHFEATGDRSSGLGAVIGMLGVSQYGAGGKLKTPQQMFLDIVDALEKQKPGKENAPMRAQLMREAGFSEEMVQVGLEGSTEVRRRLAEARRMVATQDPAQAAKYVENVGKLDAAFSALGTTITNLVSGPLVAFAVGLNRLISGWMVTPGSKEDKAVNTELSVGLREKFGNPQDVLNAITSWSGFAGGPLANLGDTLYGKGGIWEGGGRNTPEDLKKLKEAREFLKSKNQVPFVGGVGGLAPGMGSEAEVREYIRSAAKARGIDPNVAEAVWSSEGRGGYVGDFGTSFGPFQLHYSAGGKAVGDEFTKATGMHASDPKTWKSQVDFALDWANRPGGRGWADWMGWKGGQFQGLGGVGKQSSVTINVNGVTVNDSSGNADHVASNLTTAIRRSMTAANANWSVG